MKPKLFPVFRLRYKLFRQYLKSLRDYFLIRRRYLAGSTSAHLFVTLKSLFNPGEMILFFPDRPTGGSAILKICALLGYTLTTNPQKPHLAMMKWKDATHYDIAGLGNIPAGTRKIINGQSADISKQIVNRAFEDIFGYPMAVNPLVFCGPMVEKSDRNASHDGRILDGPLPPESIRDGFIYQRVIDNTVPGESTVLDHRVPVFGDAIPLVYLKYRPVDSRFSNVNSRAKLVTPEEVFSPVELSRIVSLAKRLGLDYGEVDVLRDKDGRIYVVDVNNTPFGPPNGLPEADSRIALEKMSAVFKKMITAPPFGNSLPATF